jgi:LuxR family transcriptional regulator, quorum-sensing system regulator BjaR1
MKTNCLDLIEHINRLAKIELVVDVMADAFEEFGATGMLVIRAEPGHKPQAEVLASRVHPDALQLYSGRRYARYSPILKRARHSLEPFFWTVDALLSESDPHAREMGHLAAKYGVRAGFMIPVHGPDGLKGGVSIMGPDMQVSRHDAPAVHNLGLYGFIRLHKLKRHHPGADLGLSSRERDVLIWSARGKSAAETADILRITRRTVEQHVQNICRKLGARNRTQAVALAVRDGVIEL